MLKQIAVFVENRPGRIADVLKVLAEQNIDINGLSVADTADFGVLRLILSDPELGERTLKEAGFIVKCAEVIAIDVTDTPGALHQALSALGEARLNLEYMYAFGSKLNGRAMIILKTSDSRLAVKALTERGFTLLTREMVDKRLSIDQDNAERKEEA